MRASPEESAPGPGLPVLLFPGLGASRLMSGTRNVYPPLVQDYLFHYTDWCQQMMENRQLHTLPLGDKHSLDLSVPMFSINYYSKLLAKPRVYPIPYDFRQIDHSGYLTDFYDQLRAYIQSFGRPVHLLCHSSGGLVAHWFLHCQSELWRRQWIHSVYNVNVPFGGVVTLLEHCVRNDLPMHRYVESRMFRSLGASVWNMPDLRALNHSVLTINGDVVDDYFDFYPLTEMKRSYQANEAAISSFKYPTGVETHILYSTTSELNTTAVRLDVTMGFGKKPAFTSVKGMGDNVVSLSSLMVPRQWPALSRQVFFHHIPNSEHSNVLQGL